MCARARVCVCVVCMCVCVCVCVCECHLTMVCESKTNKLISISKASELVQERSVNQFSKVYELARLVNVLAEICGLGLQRYAY